MASLIAVFGEKKVEMMSIKKGGIRVRKDALYIPDCGKSSRSCGTIHSILCDAGPAFHISAFAWSFEYSDVQPPCSPSVLNFWKSTHVVFALVFLFPSPTSETLHVAS